MTIFLLSKYFWDGPSSSVASAIHDLNSNRKIPLVGFTPRQLRILVKTLITLYFSGSGACCHKTRQKHVFITYPLKQFSPFLLAILTSSLWEGRPTISFHGVTHQNSVYASLLTPFLWLVWIMLAISFVTILTLLYIITKKFIWTIWLFAVGLEVSIMNETKLRNNFKVQFLLGIWILVIGTLLTNWYKS